MIEKFKSVLLESTGAKHLLEQEEIQSLWSGYGTIFRQHLSGGVHNSVVVKHIRLPSQNNHPRGWNTSISHDRKVNSYKVETEFYTQFCTATNTNFVLPKCLVFAQENDETFVVLEDLNEIGFPERLTSVNWKNIEMCIQWLAQFHAHYLHTKPKGLWEVGTYWHLATRPDELEVLEDLGLKANAHKIDEILNSCKYQTLVHGDAKLANFCFSEDGLKVAAVDFQYVGGGCGMKDLAYFIGSCLYEEDCEDNEEQILDFYFKELRKCLGDSIDANELEREWRSMYPIAWTDFHRFLKGWSPGHWKINSYSERIAEEVIGKIKSNGTY